MGQKVSPTGLRIGVIKDWNARWYADKKNFSTFLVEDNKIRTAIKKRYYEDSISSINISRKLSSAQNNKYSIYHLYQWKSGKQFPYPYIFHNHY